MVIKSSWLFPKGKGGWIRVVEAFVAVLIITGVILVVYDKGYVGSDDKSEEIYRLESGILQEIQINDGLRQWVLNASGATPIDWAGIPLKIRNTIENRIPAYLECTARICSTGEDCVYDTSLGKDLYVRAVLITGYPESRKLKLFCWLKD